jgi:predicted transcriptional regulator
MINFNQKIYLSFIQKITVLSDNIGENKTNLRKSKKHMEWRRNKVRELLTRGYAQYEISNTLHISQPTISRDIHYLQKELTKNKKNYGERLFDVYYNSLEGLDEVVKKLWTIIDSSKIDEKEKMKAINSIMQCYKMRFEMIQTEPELINQKRYMKDISIFDT